MDAERVIVLFAVAIAAVFALRGIARKLAKASMSNDDDTNPCDCGCGCGCNSHTGGKSNSVPKKTT